MKEIQITAGFEAASEFIERIPEIFDDPSQGLVIDARRNVLKVFDTPWGKWVVKHYRRPNGFQRFVYTFLRKPKSKRAFLYASRLAAMGIDTPKAVAFVDRGEGTLFSDGYFFSEMTSDPCVFDALTGPEVIDRRLAYEAAAFMAKIHEKGVLHGDLNLTNIMFRPEGDGWAFSVIDTNRCKFRKHLSRKECLHELRRVSHRKDLFEILIRDYAKVRGWDEEKTLEATLTQLKNFERWESVKHWFKNRKKK
ncbi:MAG: lipopolysaccharide kinase InaA family protein [Bacteroidales bacterium]|nr:lipopolysaccharide kinase InaA family protein [Bacteroidales bacterium]